MEYRKLISFGKSSYVVSLPKSWVLQQKLKKGDLIYFDEQGSNLLLQPQLSTNEGEDKEKVIPIDGKDLRRIQREIISGYVQNNKTITLMGNEIKDKAKEIQNFIQHLVAVEIVEQDSKKIVAKDFLNMNDISVDQIIRKMDIITRSMLKDCLEIFKEGHYENMILRDEDVNKFRFLIFRIIWYGMEQPSAIFKKLNLTQRDLFSYWWLSFSIEAIADHVKTIARYMKEINLAPKQQNEYLVLLGQIERMYCDVLKAYYTKNEELAHKVINERFETAQICDEFYEKNKNAHYIGYLMYSTKALIITIHTIGRIVYQGIPG